ncbi:hypothetical protein ACL00T_09650 [Curtobacterium flaccumfaciens]
MFSSSWATPDFIQKMVIASPGSIAPLRTPVQRVDSSDSSAVPRTRSSNTNSASVGSTDSPWVMCVRAIASAATDGSAVWISRSMRCIVSGT